MLWCRRERGDEARLGAYWHWLEKEEGSRRVMAFLRARDVSAFNPGVAPPTTEWLEEIMAQSRDGLESWLLEQIAGREGIFKEPIVQASHIMDLLGAGAGSHWVAGQVTYNRLAKALRNLGAYQRQLGTKRTRFWVLRPGEPVAPNETRETAAIVSIDRRKRIRADARAGMGKGAGHDGDALDWL
jgi:hypothetical protein